MDFSFSPLLGVVGAGVLGGIIGIQRQVAAKPAGFRTHVLVAAAAAAFTAMGAHLHDTRIPSYIVVGIGFLGGGAIVRHGASAHGLTTAAGLWMASAIGMLLGYSSSFGLYVALVATMLTTLALWISDEWLMTFFRIPQRLTVRIEGEPTPDCRAHVWDILMTARVQVEGVDTVSIVKQGSEGVSQLDYRLAFPRRDGVDGILRDIAAVQGVNRVDSAQPG
jgi:putative Mg2+ transporter-C (MgtC) family protein